MKCEDVREYLPLLAEDMDGGRAGPAADAVLAHLGRCASCAALAEAFRADRDRLACAGRSHDGGAPDPESFWRELRPRLVRSRRPLVLAMFRPSAVAAAAVLAMVVGISLVAADRGWIRTGPEDRSPVAAGPEEPKAGPLASGETGEERDDAARGRDQDPNLRRLAPVRRVPAVLEPVRPPAERAFPMEDPEPARVRPVDWEF